MQLVFGEIKISVYKRFSVDFTVSLHEISVDNVQPLYGPVAGGTRLTIAGQHLSVSTVRTIYIGLLPLNPDANGLVLSFTCKGFFRIIQYCILTLS